MEHENCEVIEGDLNICRSKLIEATSMSVPEADFINTILVPS